MRVFIVEDDRGLLDNLRLLLDGEPGIEVSGTADTVEGALADVPTSQSDVVLSDLGLPDGSGVELIRELKQSLPAVELMAFTVLEDRDTVLAALKAGASGYLLKGTTPRQLIEALANIETGGSPMSPRIARRVVMEFRHDDDAIHLSPREKQVLEGIDAGYAYKEIASQLGVTRHTVHGYVKGVYEKLHARGRREALEVARRKGIL